MQRSTFERVAIVNRGEAAMRFIHAAHEFNQEHGTSFANDRALHRSGPPCHVRPGGGRGSIPSARPRSSIRAHINSRAATSIMAGSNRPSRRPRADAVWVGWGFVAEHAEFADLCRDIGIVFIGPDGGRDAPVGRQDHLQAAGGEAQIRVAPWSGGPVDTLADARRHAERLGFPLLIKATAGGGGRGIRLVQFVR